MEEFPQSVSNLTEASSNLYELVKGGNLQVDPNEALEMAIGPAVAIETTHGWRIAKEKTSHKIDVVVALAQAELATVQGGQRAGIPQDATISATFFPIAIWEYIGRPQSSIDWVAGKESDPDDLGLQQTPRMGASRK